MSNRTALHSLAVAGAACLTLTACGNGTETTQETDSIPTVTIACIVQEDWCQLQVAEFTEATGIDANFVRMSAGEAVARFEASKSAPEFDAMIGGPADGHIAAFEAGLIEPYASPNAAEIPDEYKHPDGNWTGIYVGLLSFCSNSSILDRIGAEVPTSWDDLLADEFRGQVAMAHPSTSGTSYTALWTEVELSGGDQDAALEYFGKLHRNILQYPKSGSAPGQMAGRGEVATGVIFGHDCQKYANEGFTDLVTSYPSEGTGYEIGAVSLVKNAKNERGGQAYIDWALTKEAQELGPQVGSYQIPTNPEAAITDDMADPDSVTLVDYDPAAAGAAKSELTARFDREIAPEPRD